MAALVSHGSGDPADEGDLARLLREADGEELLQLLEEHAGELDPAAAAQVLRNPFAGEEAVRRIATSQDLLRDYDLRRDLAGHPKTPEVHAIRCLGTLRWRDLARLASNVRTRPRLRRQASVALCSRLPGLTLGEKISLARVAGTHVLKTLRFERHPRVFDAVLQNPHLTVGLLAPVASDPATPSPLLGALATAGRWANRYDLRLPLCRNPSTPIHLALRMLPGLRRNDIRVLARDRRLRPAVRQRALEIVEAR